MISEIYFTIMAVHFLYSSTDVASSQGMGSNVWDSFNDVHDIFSFRFREDCKIISRYTISVTSKIKVPGKNILIKRIVLYLIHKTF